MPILIMFIKVQIILLLFFSSNFFASMLPPFVTIQHKDGIIVRDSISEKGSSRIGVVHYLYSYPVVGGKVTYLNVLLPDNKKGWVYVGGEKKQFSIKNNVLTSNMPYDVPIKRASAPYDTIGVIKPKQVVAIIDRWYGRLKVRMPDHKEGWIFNGSYYFPWTSSLDKNNFQDYYFVDFTSKDVIGNMNVDLKFSEFITDQSAFRLTMSEQSEISATFLLKDQPAKAVLVLNHNASSLEDGTVFAPITIRVNGQPIARGLNPSGVGFNSDLLHISTWLKIGENKIEIELDNAKTHYLIKSLTVRY